MRLKSLQKKIRMKGGALGKPTIEVEIQQDGKETKPEEVLHKIRQQKACSRVAFTGVDPLVDQMDVLSIIAELQQGWEVIIETTGGVMPDLNIREKVTAWEVNIPPDGAKTPFAYNDDAIRFYTTQKTATFEWPVRGEQDLIEVKKAVFQYNIPWKRVILMPDTEWSEDPADLLKQLKWLEEFCLDKGAIMGNPVIRSKKPSGGQEHADSERDPGLPGEIPPDGARG